MKNLPRLISTSVLTIALVQAIAPQAFAGKPKICQGWQPMGVVKCTIAQHPRSHPTNRSPGVLS